MKKLLSLLLVAVLAFSFFGCSKKTAEDGSSSDYDAASAEVYDSNLGEFADAYDAAVEVKDNNAERYALMAVAEAKFLESAVFLPLYAVGGTYSMGSLAPNTTPQVMWGLDMYRYAEAVTTEELITAKDRTVMNRQYAKLKGTGKYSAWAKKYLKSKGYTLSDYYGKVYSEDPTTWDIFSTYLTATGAAVVNTLDFLMEYDCEGNQKPALAESYEVSDDGLTYTFKLRKGVKWVDNSGREVAEVTADDFVCGLQHVFDCKGGMEYLAGAAGADITNADEYIAGTVTDFSEVGIKAVDDYTLEYTLNEANPYFMTMLSISVFAPLNRDYYESQGGKFGKKFDSSASDYTYGKDYEHIIGCGAYLATSSTEGNSITFEANPEYYRADDVNISSIKWVFNDESDALFGYDSLNNGDVVTTELSASEVEKAKEDGTFRKYAYVKPTDATCYGMFTNLNRQAYANSNDSSKAVSPKSEEESEDTKECMNNVHFRRALFRAIDRGAYNAQSAGESLKYAALVNGFVPGNFVSLDEKTTVSINGKDTEFKAGTYFGEIVQAQLDADEMDITVWDEDGNDGLGSSSGFDGWYDPEKAAEELDAALDELGMEATEDKPVYVDLPVNTGSTEYANRGNVIKKSIEKSLGGRVVVNVVECSDREDWFYAGYYCDNGADCNYDIYDVSGWGPDYGDPQTYLGAFYRENGDLTTHLGIY